MTWPAQQSLSEPHLLRAASVQGKDRHNKSRASPEADWLLLICEEAEKEPGLTTDMILHTSKDDDNRRAT